VAHEPAQAHVWEVHPASGALASLGTLPGPALHTLGPDGRLAVWTDRDVTLFDPTGGAGVRLDLPEPPFQVVLQSGWLGTLSLSDGGSVIRVYEMP
jgi:hypothetical protein